MATAVTILGCGSSGGVPLIGCACAVCTSADPRNQRTRASILVEQGGTQLLIDTSPDLRQQALRQQLKSVDAVLYTHAHADHLHGLDDARSFNYHRGSALPIYGTAETLSEVKIRFDYAFGQGVVNGVWFKPSLEPQEIGEYDKFTVGNIDILSFLQYHGSGKSLGYRIGNIAYSTDVHKFPDESLQLLEKLDLWVVDCLRITPAPSHAHLALTLEWIDRFKPKMAVLTHMAHELDYAQLKAQLPAHIIPAYDGLTITV